MRKILKKFNQLTISVSLFFVWLTTWAIEAFAESPAVPAGTAAPAAGDAAGAAAATGASGAGQAAQAPGIGGMLFPFLLMFGIIYFLMIRPQQKRMKQQQEMLKALKHGDEVVTASGILGTITGITDKVVTVEIANNTRVKILKSQIAQVVKGQVEELA